MNEDFVIQELSSRELAAKISAILEITEACENSSLSEEFSTNIFPSVSNCLKNSHAQVRNGSIKIVHYILSHYFDKIQYPAQPLQSLFFQFVPKNEEYLEMIQESISIIIKQANPFDWAEILEKTVLKSLNKQLRLFLIGLMREIPLLLANDKYITLLEDTNFDIAIEAQTLLQFYSAKEIRYIVSKIYYSNKMPEKNKQAILKLSKEIYEKAKGVIESPKSPRRHEIPRYIHEILDLISNRTERISILELQNRSPRKRGSNMANNSSFARDGNQSNIEIRFNENGQGNNEFSQFNSENDFNFDDDEKSSQLDKRSIDNDYTSKISTINPEFPSPVQTHSQDRDFDDQISSNILQNSFSDGRNSPLQNRRASSDLSQQQENMPIPRFLSGQMNRTKTDFDTDRSGSFSQNQQNSLTKSPNSKSSKMNQRNSNIKEGKSPKSLTKSPNSKSQISATKSPNSNSPKSLTKSPNSKSQVTVTNSPRSLIKSPNSKSQASVTNSPRSLTKSPNSKSMNSVTKSPKSNLKNQENSNLEKSYQGCSSLQKSNPRSNGKSNNKNSNIMIQEGSSLQNSKSRQSQQNSAQYSRLQFDYEEDYEEDDEEFLISSAIEKDGDYPSAIVQDNERNQTNFGNSELIDPELLEDNGFNDGFEESYRTEFSKYADLPIKLRNLGNHSWIERCSYLELIQKHVNEHELTEDYGEVLDSILSAAYPLHFRVTKLLNHLAATLISFHPESLEKTKIRLLAYATSGAIQKITIDNELIKSITSEMQPADIIDTIVDVVDDYPKSGPFAIELVLVSLTTANKEIVLNKQSCTRFLCYVLYECKVPEVEHRVYSVIARTNQEIFASFASKQTFSNRAKLSKYIVKKSQPSTPKKSPMKSNLSMSTNEASIAMDSITIELSKKTDIDFDELEIAFSKVKILNFSHLTLLFQKFLTCCSFVSADEITENCESIRDICKHNFKDCQLIRFLSNDPPIELIRGLAAIATLMPTTVFEDSEIYLQPLYDYFVEANGSDRRSICVLFTAILKNTSYDIRKQEFVTEQHKLVIDTCMSKLL